MAIAAAKNMKIATFDVSAAYLNAPIEGDVYMYIPEGFEIEKGKVCKLSRSLYGLKGSPLAWWKTLEKALNSLGLHALKTDPCVFKNSKNTVYLCNYVDDGMIIGDPSEIRRILSELEKRFKITVNNQPTSYVGFEMSRSNDGISISQPSYINELLTKYKMSECNPAPTPITKSDVCTDESAPDSTYKYREVIGALIYLSTKTRPDISFAINWASRYVENPTVASIAGVKRTLRYLKGSQKLSLLYKNGGDINTIHVYTDSDYAECPDTRRSTTGYVIMFNGAPIVWGSRRQRIVAQSSTEAEFIAACEGLKELLYVKNMIEELTQEPVLCHMHIDNTSAIALIKEGRYKRSKHMEVRFKLITERYADKTFVLNHCPSSEQLADLLTKPLDRVKLERNRARLLQEPM